MSNKGSEKEENRAGIGMVKGAKGKGQLGPPN